MQARKVLLFDGHGIKAAPSLNGGAWVITAFSDVCGLDKNTDARRFRTAVSKVSSLIDQREALTNFNLKTFLRAQTPDDLPIVGSLAGYPNVFLNVGHGTHGLGMSVGCSKAVTDLLLTGTMTEEVNAKAIDPARFYL